MKEKKVKKGLVLYTIDADGCLNGLYTNENAKGMLISESLKKTSGDNMKIEGDYALHYYDHENASYVGKVKIDVCDNVYDLEWTVEGDVKPRFKGVGYRMSATQLAVVYWSN